MGTLLPSQPCQRPFTSRTKVVSIHIWYPSPLLSPCGKDGGGGEASLKLHHYLQHTSLPYSLPLLHLPLFASKAEGGGGGAVFLLILLPRLTGEAERRAHLLQPVGITELTAAVPRARGSKEALPTARQSYSSGSKICNVKGTPHSSPRWRTFLLLHRRTVL